MEQSQKDNHLPRDFRPAEITDASLLKIYKTKVNLIFPNPPSYSIAF
jgi:hypothetical protein